MWYVIKCTECGGRLFAAQADGGAVYETGHKALAKSFETARSAYDWAAKYSIFQNFIATRSV